MIEPTILTVTVSDAAVRRALSAAPHIIDEELVPPMMEAQLLLEREVKDLTPTSGAGTLRDSIGALPITFSEGVMIGEVGTSLSYAQPVETGSRPHRPPVDPIADWVQRKLGKDPKEARRIAWGIAGKIAKVGSTGKFMFRDGLAATQSQILSIIGGGVASALRRVDQWM